MHACLCVRACARACPVTMHCDAVHETGVTGRLEHDNSYVHAIYLCSYVITRYNIQLHQTICMWFLPFYV